MAQEGKFNIDLAVWKEPGGKPDVLLTNAVPQASGISYMARHYLFRSGDSLLCYGRFSNRIYRLRRAGAVPFATLHSSRWPDSDELQNLARTNDLGQLYASSYLKDITACCEARHLAWITLFDNSSLHILLDKRSGKASLTRSLAAAGLPAMDAVASTGKEFVGILNRSDGWQEREKQAGIRVPDSIRHLDAESNPVLVFFRFE